FACTAIGPGLVGHAQPRGDDTLTGGIAPYNTYLSKDGYPMTLAALEPKFWTAFCLAVGLEPNMNAVMVGPHQSGIKQGVAEIFRGRTRAEWVALAAERDCMLEPVLSPSELRADAQLAARELLFDLPSPKGPIPQVRTPVTPRDDAFAPPPAPGEHT